MWSLWVGFTNDISQYGRETNYLWWLLPLPPSHFPLRYHHRWHMKVDIVILHIYYMVFKLFLFLGTIANFPCHSHGGHQCPNSTLTKIDHVSLSHFLLKLAKISLSKKIHFRWGWISNHIFKSRHGFNWHKCKDEKESYTINLVRKGSIIKAVFFHNLPNLILGLNEPFNILHWKHSLPGQAVSSSELLYHLLCRQCSWS